MSDLIRREDVFDAIKKTGIVDTMSCYNFGKLWHSIEILPSAEPEVESFEWCHDCKEYDQEHYCCHRWTKVIRQTVEELKANERTAEVRPLEKRSETVMGWEGVCTNCGAYTIHEMNYCFGCGAKLDWGE